MTAASKAIKKSSSSSHVINNMVAKCINIYELLLKSQSLGWRKTRKINFPCSSTLCPYAILFYHARLFSIPHPTFKTLSPYTLTFLHFFTVSTYPFPSDNISQSLFFMPRYSFLSHSMYSLTSVFSSDLVWCTTWTGSMLWLWLYDRMLASNPFNLWKPVPANYIKTLQSDSEILKIVVCVFLQFLPIEQHCV